ncbi:PaaI family thioesterase [Rhodococcus sp. X156]|uniref:PaaI family thioesterase n=1 Tax=Rhodococcus sp. X156 TaxID=2499145 RepID=UPI000FDC2730|nr:PaaI family thioesterase [Rhodococcus sp. X156]
MTTTAGAPGLATTPALDADHREAAEDLVRAAREVMLAVATSEAEPAQLRAHAARLRAAVADMGGQGRPRVIRAPFPGPAAAKAAGLDQPWALFRYNPQGIPIDVFFDGTTARATLRTDALLEGPPDHLHGGFSAHLMDCMLGVLLQAQGKLVVTATLDLRYLHRTPLDASVELHARILDVSGRKTVAEGWIEVDGVRTVEARGLFIEITRAELAARSAAGNRLTAPAVEV